MDSARYGWSDQGQRRLNAEEKRALIAFLKTLNGRVRDGLR